MILVDYLLNCISLYLLSIFVVGVPYIRYMNACESASKCFLFWLDKDNIMFRIVQYLKTRNNRNRYF